MIKSRRKMEYGDDFSKKCINCVKCKENTDIFEGNIVHVCGVDGTVLNSLFPPGITTCDKFVQKK